MNAPTATLPQSVQASAMTATATDADSPRTQIDVASSNEQAADARKSTPKTKKKGGLFSFWTNRTTRKKEIAALRASQDEMAGMMRDMCQIIEQSGASQAQVIEERVLRPFPIMAMEAINKGQEKVQGTLKSLDVHMEKSNARESQVLQTLTEVKTLGGHSNTVLGEVSTAMGGVQSEMGRNSETFTILYSKMERAEEKFSLSMAKLQRRALWINSLLGLGIIGTFGTVAYFLYQVQENGGMLNLAL